MDPAKYAEIFLDESREHLTAVNQQLLEWERHPQASEPVTVIFRAVHNIKGMAATMGYTTVATVAHRVENVLDLLRRGEVGAEQEILDLLFRSTDALERAIDAAVSPGSQAIDATSLIAELDQKATQLESGTARPSAERPSAPELPAPALGGRLVRVVIDDNSALKGARAMVVLERLGSFGAVFDVQPAPAVLETEDFDGVFEARVETGVSDEDIILAVRNAGEIAEVVVGAPVTRPVHDEPATSRTRHLRVDLRRLDNLMNLIGELVTARGRLVELSAQRTDADLEDLVIRISHLSQDLQSEIIQARMTPGWQVFDRFPRLVRDIARQLKKRVQFEIEGKDIELDRAILDELGDPLVHLLRNAIDHGLETPADRKKAGKPPEGRITLSASRDRSSVVIRVSDDGRGIDRDTILRNAKQRKLVGSEVETLRDDTLLKVLSRPGFSTAGSVSNVSGRGVGIDVVMTRMRSFGGSLDLRTEVGKGTTFTLRLPPTLAIVPALLAQVGEERYALPLTHVEETVDLEPRNVTDIEGSRSMVLRDRLVPLVHLRELVELGGDPPARQPVIILQIGDRRSGLVVDRLSGQRDIVVKSFDPPRGTAPIFSGVTILGDGQAIFILDAARLV